MIEKIIIALLFVLPILVISIHYLVSLAKNAVLHQLIQIIFCALMLFSGLNLFFSSNTSIVIQVANWPTPYGICLVFDQLTKLMLIIFSYAFTCNILFSLQEKQSAKQKAVFYQGSSLLLLGVIGALSTYDIFNLYVWSEVMLVSAFILLSVSDNNNLKKIFFYAKFNIIGTLLLLLSIALIYGITGQLNYAAITQSFLQHHNPIIIVACLLFLLSLGIKGAIFPFYFWLPEAYSNTCYSSTLMLSGLVTKVMMIVILRLVWLWLPLKSPFITNTFMAISLLTMFLGVIGAASHHHIRKILTFHIISQLGYILLAIFINSSLAIVAAIYFLIHNIFVKNGLIMTSGIIEKKYHTDNLDKLGTIIKHSPLLAACFFIFSMSLAGFPPLSGFWGKFLILKSAFDNHHYISLLVAIFVSLLTLYSMLKIWRYAYCQAGSLVIKEKKSYQLNRVECISLLCVIIIPILLGFFPNKIMVNLNHIANHLRQPELTVNAMLRGNR